LEFDHIGVFVPTLDVGREQVAALLPITHFTDPVDDELLRVSVQFGVDESGVRYELVAPFGSETPVDTVLKSGKNILNHVAYRVTDLDAQISRLRAEGAIPLSAPQPAVAFNSSRVIFFLTPLRFIIELIESS